MKARTWSIISLLCLLGAIYCWHLGEQKRLALPGLVYPGDQLLQLGITWQVGPDELLVEEHLVRVGGAVDR